MKESEEGPFGKNFFLWMGARFCSHLARNMLEVGLVWQVYQITRSPVSLGLLGLAEAIPFLSTSLWAGHLVDRHRKKPFMLGAAAALLACAAVLFLFGDRVKSSILFYAVIALSGVTVSFGNVASIVTLQMMVPRADYPRAAAWNLSSFTIARILGPILGGALISSHSAGLSYAVSGALLGASLLLLTGIRFPDAPTDTAGESAVQRIREGIRFVRSQPLILACMLLDMVAVLFGDAAALFPIFAEMLNAGPLGFGLLRASPALGSAVLSLSNAARPFVKPSWSWIKRAVTAFGLFMIAFALSKSLWLACLFLALSGAVDGISVIIRQSVYQANTPDALRGRVSALSGIFISTSNEIGAFESGVAARLMGPVNSVLFGGTMTLLTVFAMSRVFKRLSDPEGGEA